MPRRVRPVRRPRRQHRKRDHVGIAPKLHCPSSGKVIFSSRAEAEGAIGKRAHNPDGSAIRAYYHSDCQAYHLTSKEPNATKEPPAC